RIEKQAGASVEKTGSAVRPTFNPIRTPGPALLGGQRLHAEGRAWIERVRCSCRPELRAKLRGACPTWTTHPPLSRLASSRTRTRRHVCRCRLRSDSCK